MFAFSKPSAALVVLAELAAFSIKAGPRLPLKVAAGTLLTLGTLRTWQFLIQASGQAGLRGRNPSRRLGSGAPTPPLVHPPSAAAPQSIRHAHQLEKGLPSIWDWEPPAQDSSGAWHILRQLAMTANK